MNRNRMKKASVAIMCLIISLISCSPVPLIQSPRIKPGLSVSASIKESGPEKAPYIDERTKQKRYFATHELLPVSFAIGIARRLELSGMAFPYPYPMAFQFPPPNWLWSGNVKLNLFDVGKGNFRNCAAAVFGGTNGYYGEHEDVFNYYAGASCGTMANFANTDIEFVLQSSYSVEKKISLEYRENYRIVWVQPAAGMIVHPGWLEIVHVGIGANYSLPVKSRVEYRLLNARANSVAINSAGGGFTFLGELRISIL
jgi:hypothetical protein